MAHVLQPVPEWWEQPQEQPKTERTHQRGNGKEGEDVEGKHTDGVKAEDKVDGARIVEKKEREEVDGQRLRNAAGRRGTARAANTTSCATVTFLTERLRHACSLGFHVLSVCVSLRQTTHE